MVDIMLGCGKTSLATDVGSDTTPSISELFVAIVGSTSITDVAETCSTTLIPIRELAPYD